MPIRELPEGVFLTGDRIIINEDGEIIFYQIIHQGNTISLVCVGNLEQGRSFKMPNELYDKISPKLFDVRQALAHK